jgi:thiamine kinase-like enzyme
LAILETVRDALHLLDRVSTLLGNKVLSATPVVGGYTPATRLLCQTAKGRVFVKAGSTPLTAEFVRREIEVYKSISGSFMPQLIAHQDHETEPVLILEDLSTAYWPPPWTPTTVELVLMQIDSIHGVKPPLEPFSKVHGPVPTGWTEVAQHPLPFLSLKLTSEQWLDATLPTLVQYESRCPTDGDTLAHCDIRSDNICDAGGRALLVDWNQACKGNPDLDLGFWLPSLHYEGGPAPAQILPHAPEVAAWVSGFVASRAGLAIIPDAPLVREVQKKQLRAALPWVVEALDLPRLPK